MEKIFFIIRGLPGSGKSSLAEQLNLDGYCEADMYFMRSGEYNFNPTELPEAHDWCRKTVLSFLKIGFDRVGVCNTFTTEKEILPYIEMAKQCGYKIFTIVVENRHGMESIHNVPAETIEKMRNRFSIKL